MVRIVQPGQGVAIVEYLKKIYNSVGDAGTSPINVSGRTSLAHLGDIAYRVDDTRLQGGFSRMIYNSSTAAPLSVTVNLNAANCGRSIMEVWVKSSAAATFYVQASRNNTDWRTIDIIELTGAGEEHRGYRNAYPYLKVYTDAANDNEIEIITIGG